MAFCSHGFLQPWLTAAMAFCKAMACFVAKCGPSVVTYLKLPKSSPLAAPTSRYRRFLPAVSLHYRDDSSNVPSSNRNPQVPTSVRGRDLDAVLDSLVPADMKPYRLVAGGEVRARTGAGAGCCIALWLGIGYHWLPYCLLDDPNPLLLLCSAVNATLIAWDSAMALLLSLLMALLLSLLMALLLALLQGTRVTQALDPCSTSHTRNPPPRCRAHA